jgi:hypothetical protein
VIVALGDDETLIDLQELRRNQETPINIKNWLKGLIEDTEKHWREVTEQWPDALSAWSGQLEEIESKFTLGEHEFASNLSLWLRRQKDPGDTASWGGAFFLPSIPARLRMLLAPQMDATPLSIPGRRTGMIWFSGSSAKGIVSFVGTGDYPNRLEAEFESRA